MTWSTEATQTIYANAGHSALQFYVHFRLSEMTLIACYFDTYNSNARYIRGVISAPPTNTITWGSDSVCDTYGVSGAACFAGCVDSGGIPWLFTPQTTGYYAVAKATNPLTATFADTYWNAVQAVIDSHSDDGTRGQLLALGSGNIVAVYSDINNGAGNKWLRAKVYTTSFGSTINLWGADVTGSASGNLWAASQISATDLAVLGVAATSTLGFKTSSDGSTWSSATAPDWPTSGFATSGLTLANDGTSYYAFAIRGDANNTVSYNKRTGTTWGGWTDLETSAQVRSYLQVAGASSSKLPVIWTEVNGSNYDLVGATYSLAAPPAASSAAVLLMLTQMRGV